ncbi:MAG: hypothetical protein SX243_18425 [Acidobacteriota bacterium]|nr:hypothetical protein [Acidobacteriota bacterium]
MTSQHGTLSDPWNHPPTPYQGPNLEEVTSPEAVDAVIEALFPEGLPSPRGGEGRVSHVTACWLSGEEGQELRTLAINEHTPKSPWDAFVLSLCRARAGAILTTGANLRAEPKLHHQALVGEPAAGALEAWRQREGLEGPPLSVVLTSGRDLDWQHPLFAGETAIFTGRSGAELLGEAAEARGVPVVAADEPGPREVVRWLRESGRGPVSIEAGPSTSQELYREPSLVDELILSLFHGDEVPEPARGKALLKTEELANVFPLASSPRWVDEASGRWSFRRLSRG